MSQFTEDSKIQEIASAYALDAQDFARNHFKLNLDWSDKSIEHIETILGVLHDQMAKAKPTEEQLFRFAKMFGSYVGEVFRRNHGATWGIVNLDGQEFPGLKANGSAGLFWPWGRTQNRIVNGAEDNIWHYYQVLLEREGWDSAPSAQGKSTKQHRPWWKIF